MSAPARVKKLVTEELPLEERIRRRAYELYIRRVNQPGSDIGDWLQAEKEILSALARKAAFDRKKKLSAHRKRRA